MAIRTLTGHLTATNKRHISAMFDAERMAARINRTTYYITPDGDTYKVAITRRESDDWGTMRDRTHSATFTTH